MNHYVVGTGRVGLLMVQLLQEAGESVLGGWTRSRTRAEEIKRNHPGISMDWGSLPQIPPNVDCIWVTVPDDVIGPMTSTLATTVESPETRTVLHCSGATPTRVLRHNWPSVGETVGVHPLQAFVGDHRDRQQAQGAHWFMSGDPRGLEKVERILNALQLNIHSLPDEDRTGYHAAAVLASNGLVALAAWGETVMPGQGLTPLLPLMEGTLNNLKERGTHRSLTGPIARGDHKVVEEHLNHLVEHHPHLLEGYRTLSLTLLRLREEASPPLEAEQLKRLLQVLSSPQS